MARRLCCPRDRRNFLLFFPLLLDGHRKLSWRGLTIRFGEDLRSGLGGAGVSPACAFVPADRTKPRPIGSRFLKTSAEMASRASSPKRGPLPSCGHSGYAINKF